jgi:hypothetical protein
MLVPDVLEVIGAGFGRTGTLSLKAALEELGFSPCYHMFEVIEHPEHVPIWQAATDRKPVDFDALFRGYRAAVDWPACSFYRELMEIFPSAKVLLTRRDPERWYDSVKSTIYLTSRRTTGSDDDRARRKMIRELVWEGTFGGELKNKTRAIEAFERHNEEVIRTVPKERLLVYEVKQGWQPLCAFLGRPVPKDKAFPHLNDTASFIERIKDPG